MGSLQLHPKNAQTLQLKIFLDTRDIAIYTSFMAEKMKQVAVRMGPSLQTAITKAAKKTKESFSGFVRKAASNRIAQEKA